MYPYGSLNWRCKGKNHPPPVQDHVHNRNGPQILRLDSTGEITSDDNPSPMERNSCSLKDMGSIIENAFRKFGPKTHFNNTGCLTNKTFNMASNGPHPSHMMSQSPVVHQRPVQQAWGKAGMLPCLSPRMASQQKMLNELQFTNLFQNNLQQQQHYWYHPAMSAKHVPTKRYNRYRNFHPNGISAKHAGKNSKNNQETHHSKMDVPSQKHNVNKCDERTEKIKDSSTNKKEPAQNDAITQCRKIIDHKKANDNYNVKLKDSNIQVLASTARGSIETSLDNCDILKAAYIINDVNNLCREEKDVPMDWFDGGMHDASADISDNLEDCVPNKLQNVCDETVDIVEKENNASKCKDFQRECSVLSDIFADNSAISLTCILQDLETNPSQSNASSSEEVNSATESTKGEKVEKPMTETSQNQKEEKTSTSDDKKPQDYSFVLHVRDNKKWRASSKKRRRKAKAKKEEEASVVDSSEKSAKEECSSPSDKKSGCNKLAFILGFDPKNLSTSPTQSHSFLVSFSDSGSDFSDDDGFSDDEDEVDPLLNCSEFACPLDLDLICSINHSQPDNEGTSSELEEINKSWRINIKVNPQQTPPRKCDKKVHFADINNLCTVHPMIAWSYAYQAARKGPWEQYARDRGRFQRRVEETEKLLGPVFDPKRRESAYSHIVNA